MKLSPPFAAQAADPSRRTVLKTGAAGVALLLAGRWLAPTAAASSDTVPAFLTGDDTAVLRRVVPVLLQGALPQDRAEQAAAIAEIIAGMDRAILFLPPGVRKELRDLFNLLTTGVTRALVAGVWSPWDKAADRDIEAFLSSWRASRFGLLRSAYTALHDLTVGSWYGNPKSWARIGYRGPPRLS